MRLVTVFGRGAKAVAPILVIVLVAMGGGFALANHDPNSIHACANAATGALRMVASAADCRPGESAVQWSVQGPQGEPGAAGVSGYEVIRKSTHVDPLTTREVRTPCPLGKVVVGGGYENAPDRQYRIFSSYPGFFLVDDDLTGEEVRRHGWSVEAHSEGHADNPLSTFAICVNET